MISNAEKRKRAEYLFDEIGTIDERYISQAGSYRPAQGRRRGFMAIAAACAAILIVFTSVYSIFNRALNNKTADSDDAVAIISLAGALEAAREYGSSDIANPDETRFYDMVYTAEKINFFDGVPRLIWKYGDENIYYFMSISVGDCEKLLKNIGEGSSLAGSAAQGCRVWISSGNGLVYSPQLMVSNGNIGFGGLFEYDPEIEPSAEYSRFIYNLITERT